mmetsp:Transcript_139320/g.267150  ORF Transcript_139320/g.267150 Transcript_139320/m.267150 type:complete len:83 (-) Transcript_139320:235-483(-)
MNQKMIDRVSLSQICSSSYVQQLPLGSSLSIAGQKTSFRVCARASDKTAAVKIGAHARMQFALKPCMSRITLAQSSFKIVSR